MSATTPPDATRFTRFTDRVYGFEDIFYREHPPLDAVDTRPLPALPPPRFLFDRDALTLGFKTNGETFRIDLAAVTVRGAPLRFLDDAGKEIAPPTDFLERCGLAVRGEIEAAAWEVFHNRRHYRAGLFSNDIPDFDVFDALRDGATLDWHLGAILWPKQGPLLKHAVPIFDLEPDDDDSGNFVQSRYLCRGGSMLISGPTGIGKSSLAMQLAIAWALGKPCLGFSPGRPLATLIVQSENDAGDLMEQRDGIIAGLGLDEQADGILNEMVSVATVDDCSGRDFFVRLERLIRDWQPDIVILDPLLAFVGGDLSRQEVAADFLRHRLNPILHRAGIACLIVHHTGKPARDGKEGPHQDYSGLGSSELSNWARAICNLTVEGDAYCLTLGKRGPRAGILDDMGCTRVWLRHSVNRICWETCDPATVASKSKPKTPDDLVAQVPLSPARILKASLIERGKAAGIGENRARAFLAELLDAGTLHLHRVKRPGTNPNQYIARHPQPTQPELLNEPS